MATRLENLKWKLYLMKRDILFEYGIRTGLIQMYDNELIKNLRHVYCGGLPASILLLHRDLSNGRCYDRGPLIALGFLDDDFRVVDADIDSLRLNPKYIDEYRKGLTSEYFPNHCFAERAKKDGSTWVYDTSLGLVFEKNFYYQLEHPIITKVNDRETTLNFLYEDFQRESDIEKDKDILPIVLPIIENSKEAVQPFYLENLQQEIEILKQELNYDEIYNEMKNDMLMRGFRR